MAVNTKSLPNAARSPVVLLGLVKFSDIVLIVLVALVTYWSYHGLQAVPGRYWLTILICALVASQVFHAVGLYRFAMLDNMGGQTTKLTFGWLLVGLTLIALFFFTKTSDDFSRVWASCTPMAEWQS